MIFYSPAARPQEIELLGSHSLQTLCHHIYCIENSCVTGELSGAFYIEGTFYTDDSDKDKDSVAATLRTIEKMNTWINSTSFVHLSHSSSGRHTRKRKCSDQIASHESAAVVKSMSCRLDDVEFNQNKKYLYFHKAGCEHIISFTEIRAVAREVLSNEMNHLPKTTQHTVIFRRKCGVCLIQSAKLLCFGDRLATSNPFFYCEHCYYLLHYDKHGVLLYDDYHVFDYDHDG